MSSDKATFNEKTVTIVEQAISRIKQPATTGEIVRFLKQNKVYDNLRNSEGSIGDRTFRTRIVNTAKLGKGNKIAVKVNPNTNKPLLHKGTAYLLYVDEQKRDYGEDDLKKMSHHLTGVNRGKKRVRGSPNALSGIKDSEFMTRMVNEIRGFETLMETVAPEQWIKMTMKNKANAFKSDTHRKIKAAISSIMLIEDEEISVFSFEEEN